MNARQFLERLLPQVGVIFIATPVPGGTKKGWINTDHASLDTAVHQTNTLTFQNQAAYFALSTYKAARVWDATFRDTAGVVVGKWRSRTQDNAQYIKSFFLDLDVDPSDPQKFPNKATALAELGAFLSKIGMPNPMIVDSGGGFHVYWPLQQAVATTDWRPVADQFKKICLTENFKADRSLTSDQARVLRVAGGYNFRRGAAVKVLTEGDGTFTFEDLQQRIDTYAQLVNLPGYGGPGVAGIAIGAAPITVFSSVPDNLGVTNDPLHFGRITFACAQVGLQVATRGAGVGEKLWRAALGLAKFSEPQRDAYRAVSDGHADYDEAATITKMDNWRTGPTTCEHFHQENPLTCERCPHHQQITSPAQLGRMVIAAVAPQVITVDSTGASTVVVLPDPPEGYVRRKDGSIAVQIEDKDGVLSWETICPLDLYPLSIQRQNPDESEIRERSMWRAHLPRLGPQDMELLSADLSDAKRLHKFMLDKGVYMSADHAKSTQAYMTAYLQKLAAEADREKLYERLGWHDNRATFVLGDRLLLRDGRSIPHAPSAQIKAVTKGGVKTAGSLGGWKDAIQFYNRAGYEGHRFFLYAAFGAPLFHMNDTGNKGVLMTASGQSGRGKTTCLKACASVWGAPESLILNGNKDGSTINALYATLGSYHSLPFLWDDITEREPDELRRVLLNISQGAGKARMKDGATLSGSQFSWETIVLASANTDDISRIMSSGKDVQPHLMRLVGVEFATVDNGPEAKIKADIFLRAINQNYGHAGPIYLRAVLTHYDKIVKGFTANVAKVDRLLNSSNASAERFWSATVAAAYTGAQLAASCGLINTFPVEADLLWMVQHMTMQRRVIEEGRSSCLELLNEFLEQHVGDTLVVSAKGSSNLDNVVRTPARELLIRHDLDAKIIYASRTAIMDYCAEVRTPYRTMQNELMAAKVLIDPNKQKVLGADTPLSKGQTRTWKIDATKLEPAVVSTSATGRPATPTSATLPANVTPITGRAAA